MGTSPGWGVALIPLISACVMEIAPGPRPPPAPAKSGDIGLAIATRAMPSGLRVVTVRDPRATEVQVTVSYGVGAGADGSQPGLAHLVEHLMFQQDLDGQSLFSHLEDSATYFNAATTFDATTYVARGPKRSLDKLLAIEATRIEERCRTITDKTFLRERQVVLSELEERNQDSEVYRALYLALYPEGHPYRRSIGGHVASVSAITLEQACAFADTYYAPYNAVLVVSGPLTEAELDSALARISERISKRSGSALQPPPPAALRPQRMTVPAPIDEDVLVLAWPLPLEPQLQARARAVGSALPLLVDSQIKGLVTAVELGDRHAPMFGLAVLPGDGETFREAFDGTRRGVASLARVLRDSDPRNLDRVVFDRVQQSAIYGLYSRLEDGSSRDQEFAHVVLAGRTPNASVASELAALRGLSRQDAAALAAEYFAPSTPTVVRLEANADKKRGDTIKLRRPVHDLGKRRAPVDPALASKPAEAQGSPAVTARTRVLPNGLKVVLLPVTTVPTFEARLIFGAGTGDEPDTHKGVALLAAHTLTFDLHHLHDAVAFVRAGGMRNTDVTTDRTTFSVQGLDMNLDVALAGLRRWVCDGVYDDSAASFVNVMTRAAKRRDDQGLLTDAWRASLFGNRHPYVKAGIVRHANRALTLDDARGFRRAYYTPDNATLVVAGRFDIDLVDRWIDFLFADWRGRSAERKAVPARPSVASLAKVDDTTLVQIRIAIFASERSRAERLVVAAMLSELARDVRHRLGASYAFDAQLLETRLTSAYLIGGFVDAGRAKEVVEFVRDRIQALRRDPTAAARAFVIARNHVLTQLRSGLGSAVELANRVERDVEMSRGPLSDLQTAKAVSTLTIDEMSAALADLDFARATVLMNGPEDELKSAYTALGRKAMYLNSPQQTTTSAPGGTPPSFADQEQRVRISDIAPPLTLQPMPRLMWMASAGIARADIGFPGGSFGGYSLTGAVGYRYGWENAVGLHVSAARLASDDTTLVPVNLLAMWHLGGRQQTWINLLLGMHVERFPNEWATAPLFGVEGGMDLTGDIGLALRWDSAFQSSVGYAALALSLTYRQ